MVNTDTFQIMLNDFKELTERIEKLRSFLTNKEKFEKLDMLNRDLLIAQFKNMEGYQAILSIRLGLNAPEKVETSSNSEDIPEVIDEPSSGI